MTETTQELLARLTGFTPGPWIYRYTSIGHTVRQPNAVNAISVSNHGGNPEKDAALIAAAPTLHRIATEQSDEIERLREYATHKRNCNMMSAFIQGKFCTCGFNAARAALGEQT